MYITLHCGGMPFNGESVKTQSLGGSETAAYYVARELAKEGHRVTLFTNHKETGVWDGVNYQWAGDIAEHAPLGDRFTFYAEHTPSDILIIQRNPDAWRHDWMAKVRLWWIHDLALLRNRHRVGNSLWNCDGVLTVSEYHKEQVCKVYQLDPEFVHVLRNGVDLEMIQNADAWESDDRLFTMVYSSRPERGLEHHVRPGGIMERLQDEAPNARLFVCMYSNVAPQMRDYYQYLWQRCEELPNVVNMGSLSKDELASLMKSADAVVYPTEFEEVSCITAMEAAAAGVPLISSRHGALPETCQGGGAILFDLDNGKADEESFVTYLSAAAKDRKILAPYARAQRKKAPEYSWEGRGDDIVRVFQAIRDKAVNSNSIAKHFMKMSDIYALDYFLDNIKDGDNPIIHGVETELAECYRFMEQDDWQEHYDAYYQHEEEKGVEYGPEEPSGQTRYEHVLSVIKDLPAGARILDYGCAHGHYLNNFAKHCPDKTFVGVEIAQSNVDKARAWAPDNATFYQGKLIAGGLFNSQNEHLNLDSFDFILAAEVLEHVPNPQAIVDGLCSYLAPDGVFMATTPYGPWESTGYRREWPWRAHVHHFERADLAEAFGHHPGFNVVVAPFSGGHEGKGSYVWRFAKPTELSRSIDYNRKIAETVPRQTVTACMIVRDAEGSLRDTLLNIRDVVDEICIGVDVETKDDTPGVINRFADECHNYPVVRSILISSPTKTGFDEARNTTVEMASGDWVFWIDADEKVSYPDRILKYLRHNQYAGYAIKQHHFSAEPLGVMKTDIPVRLFRNDGIRFFGRVHEHPETALNKGVGRVMMTHDVDILHNGYTNESVRRGRFWRNISLMARDREDYPDRTLGKFLWLRDLCQMCQYELESNGGRMTQGIADRVEQGIDIFLELVEKGEVRYVLDSLQFYSPLVRLSQKGFHASFAVKADPFNDIDENSMNIYTGTFYNKEHFDKVVRLLYDTAVKDVDNEYL